MYLDYPVIGYQTWLIEIYTTDNDGNTKRNYDMEYDLQQDLVKNTPASYYNPERRHLI